jgi:hypothetical protein
MSGIWYQVSDFGRFPILHKSGLPPPSYPFRIRGQASGIGSPVSDGDDLWFVV